MGGASAMSSIDRVMKAHGDEIMAEFAEGVPASLSGLFKNLELENAVYGIKVHWMFEDGSLEGPLMDIDDLAERYPTARWHTDGPGGPGAAAP